MYSLFVGLAIIASVLLVLVVLVQSPKGDGLGSQFGGQAASRFMGVQKATDILEKITWGAAAFILLMAVFANSSFVRNGNAPERLQQQSPNLEVIQESPSLPEENAPLSSDDEETQTEQAPSTNP